MLELPQDLWNIIIGFVDNESYLFIALVCREFKFLYEKKLIFQLVGRVYVDAAKYYFRLTYDQEKILRNAKVSRLKDVVGSKHLFKWAWNDDNFPWKATTCAAIALNGNLDMLQLARSRCFPWDYKTCYNAALRGDYEMLTWACENECPMDGDPDDPDNHFSYWQDRRFYIICNVFKNKNFVPDGIIYGALTDYYEDGAEILLWIKKTKKNKYNKKMIDISIKKCYLDITYLRLDNGEYKFDSDAINNAIRTGNLDIAKWIYSYTNAKFDKQTTYEIALNGNYDMMKFIFSHSLSLHDGILEIAIKQRDLEMLLLYTNYSDDDDEDYRCIWIIDNCNLDEIEWIYSIRYPMKNAIYYAATNGHIDTIKLIRINDPNCPWDHEIVSNAFCEAEYKTVQWLMENGCPTDDNICDDICDDGDLGLIEWLNSYDCPCGSDNHAIK